MELLNDIWFKIMIFITNIMLTITDFLAPRGVYTFYYRTTEKEEIEKIINFMVHTGIVHPNEVD